MKRVSKNVKGMTLVEIIIALFVFTVTSLILVQVGSTISELVKQSNHVNKKTSIEAPLVENGAASIDVTRTEYYADPVNKTGRDYSKDTEVITVVNPNLQAYKIDGSSENLSGLRVTLDYDSVEVELQGACFTASPAVAGKSDASTNSDLKYIYISKWLTTGGNMWVDNHPLEDE